jgi:hypothetical protein
LSLYYCYYYFLRYGDVPSGGTQKIADWNEDAIFRNEGWGKKPEFPATGDQKCWENPVSCSSPFSQRFDTVKISPSTPKIHIRSSRDAVLLLDGLLPILESVSILDNFR